MGGQHSDFAITLAPLERGEARLIQPRGPLDLAGAELLLRVLDFVTDKLGQRAVVDFRGVTTISAEAALALPARATRSLLSGRRLPALRAEEEAAFGIAATAVVCVLRSRT